MVPNKPSRITKKYINIYTVTKKHTNQSTLQVKVLELREGDRIFVRAGEAEMNVVDPLEDGYNIYIHIIIDD